ncbi:unnamed protein product [Dicrocoelium dendriticum]|nr:unnamed protein product [Dicrocoelium dendriticum]
MDVVTSEDEGKNEEPEVPISAMNYNILSPDALSKPRATYPLQHTEMDEIELRSRALRSLLLKRQTNEISLDSKLPGYDHPFEAHATKRLCIGSGKQRSFQGNQQKFVITVGDSSETDEPSSALIQRGTPTTYITRQKPCMELSELGKVATRSSVAQSKAEAAKSKSASMDVNLMDLKMRLLRLKLTLKRQERIVEERRKVAQRLASTSKDLQNRLKRTERLMKDADESVSKAERIRDSIERRTQAIQETYNRLTEITDREPWSTSTTVQDKDMKPVSSCIMPAPNDSLRKEITSDSLAILLEARVSTAYFSFYRFEFPVPCIRPSETASSNADYAQPKPELPASTWNPDSSRMRIDPMVPMCPYLLDGDCKDSSCPWQHPTNSSTSCRPQQTPWFPATSSKKSDTHVLTKSNATNFCPVCKQLFSTASSDATHSDIIRKWHTHYFAWKRSSVKESADNFAKFRHMSCTLIHQYPTDWDLGKHHLATVCATHHPKRMKNIVEYLKSANFPIDALRLVFRHPSLSCAQRQSIAQACLDHLVPLIQLSPHLTDILSSPSTSFVYVVYHLAILHLECESDEKQLNELLNKYLSTFPKSHPVQSGLWWFRLALAVDKRLPSEDALFSVANLPASNQSNLTANRRLIEDAAAELRIPYGSVTLFDSISVWSKDSILPVCYLSVVFFYVQLLIIRQQYKAVADLCLHLATTPGLISTDDLFFPTGVFAMFRRKSFFDWSTFVSELIEPYRSRYDTSFRIELGFLLAHLAWQKKALKDCKSAIMESLANLILLPSDADIDIIKAFEELLGVHRTEAQVDSPLELLCVRGRTYLLLTYGLFSLLYSNTNWMTTLNYLVLCYRKHLDSMSGGEHTLFDKLLLHMIVTFLNRTYDPTNDVAYMEKLSSVMFVRPLLLQQCLTPSWFIELVQRINFASLPSPGLRHDVCVRLVEVHGTRLIPPLCRRLFVLNDRFLAQSLCAIGRLDKPDQADFWLLYAALTIISSAGAANTERAVSSLLQNTELTELFAEAVSAVPSSRKLWKQYAWAVQSAGVGIEELVRRARQFQMLHAVSGISPPVDTKLLASAASKAQATDIIPSGTTPISRPLSSLGPAVISPKPTFSALGVISQPLTSTCVALVPSSSPYKSALTPVSRPMPPAVITPKPRFSALGVTSQPSTSTWIAPAPSSSPYKSVFMPQNHGVNHNPPPPRQAATSALVVSASTQKPIPLMSLPLPVPRFVTSWGNWPTSAVLRAPSPVVAVTPTPGNPPQRVSRFTPLNGMPPQRGVGTVPRGIGAAPLLGNMSQFPTPTAPSPSVIRPPFRPSAPWRRKKKKRKQKLAAANAMVSASSK